MNESSHVFGDKKKWKKIYKNGIMQLFSAGYSISKDSSVDLGVNSKIVQIRPTVKVVCTKI